MKITYFPSEKLRIEDLNVYELHFGMLMNDVVAMLGTPDAQLVRGLERYRVHQYTRYSFFINYDDLNTIDSFDFYGLEDLYVLDKPMSKMTYNDIQSWLVHEDIEMEVDVCEFKSRAKGIYGWTDDLEKKDETIECLSFFPGTPSNSALLSSNEEETSR